MSISAAQELRPLIKIAIPAILAQLAMMGLAVIDVVMAGNFGANALASVSVGTNVLNPVFVFVAGVFLAMNPIIAQLNGKGAKGEIAPVLHSGMLLGALLSLPTVVFLVFSDSVLALMNIRAEIIDSTYRYLLALSYGMPGLFLFFALRFFNQGMFNNQSVLIINIAAMPINVLLNYWFMYGGLGLPAMGVEGIGFATTVVWYLTAFALFLYTRSFKEYQPLSLFSQGFKPQLSVIKEIFRIGTPMGIAIGLEIAMFAIIGVIIGSYTVDLISAHQIAINIASVAFMLPLGLSFGTTARVGYYIGRGDAVRARYVGNLGLWLSIGLALFTCTTLILGGQTIIGWYTQDQAIIELATGLLFFAGVFQISDASQASFSGSLRGMKDAKYPMFISAIAYIGIGLPSGILLGETYGYGVKGFWIGLISSLSFAAVALYLRYNYLSKKAIAEQEQTANIPATGV